MKIYFIERKDGMIFNSYQVGGSPPLEDQHRRKEVAVSVLGGNVQDWSGKEAEYMPQQGKTIRLIEPDSQGGYVIHQNALVKISGMTVTLTRGWFRGCTLMDQDDSHQFTISETEQSVALDVVQDDQSGAIDLQPYTWDHTVDPPEVKSNPPAGVTVLKKDILRGILPAGADSLELLIPEED